MSAAATRSFWTDGEHEAFVEALNMYGQDWKKIEANISGLGGSKTVLQIRNYFQKYNQRDSTQPETTAANSPFVAGEKRRSSYQEQGNTKQQRTDNTKLPWGHGNSILFNPAAFTQWLAARQFGSSTQYPLPEDVHEQQHRQLENAKFFIHNALIALQKQPPPMNGPNFANLYSFLDSLLCNSPDYEEKLHSMNAIDRETLQLLMHNLAINLSSQQFRDQHFHMMQQYKEHISQPHASLPCTISDFENLEAFNSPQ